MPTEVMYSNLATPPYSDLTMSVFSYITMDRRRLAPPAIDTANCHSDSRARLVTYRIWAHIVIHDKLPPLPHGSRSLLSCITISLPRARDLSELTASETALSYMTSCLCHATTGGLHGEVIVSVGLMLSSHGGSGYAYSSCSFIDFLWRAHHPNVGASFKHYPFVFKVDLMTHLA